jgi:hypothetical protein
LIVVVRPIGDDVALGGECSMGGRVIVALDTPNSDHRAVASTDRRLQELSSTLGLDWRSTSEFAAPAFAVIREVGRSRAIRLPRAHTGREVLSMPSADRRSPRASISPTYFSALTVDGVGLDAVVDHYLNWVEGRDNAKSRRRRQGVPQPLPREKLLSAEGGTLDGTNGAQIATRRAGDTFALRFVHRDDQHPDIHWYSVVRMSEVAPEGGALRAVRVEHASGRAMPPFKRLPPIAGAPAVLGWLLELPEARPRQRDLATPNVIHVRRGDVEHFVKYELLEKSRRLPLLLVSPDKDSGEPLVNPAELAGRLLAQVVVARIDADATREFEQAFVSRGFGREMGVCFDGAARLYHPGLSVGQNPREHYLWLPYRLQGFGEGATHRLAGEVAERVTWRALPPRFFSVVEDLDRERVRKQTQTALQATVADVPDVSQKVTSLEQLVQQLKQQLNASEEEHDFLEAEAIRIEKELGDSQQRLEVAEQERDEARARTNAEQARVVALEARGVGLSPEQVSALRGLMNDRVESLADALLLIELLYGEQVTILASAWSSAKESAAFKKPKKAWELLQCLASNYWEAVQNGGDSEARKCFTGKTFASGESETVKGRKGARDRRTFRYKGNGVIMWKHLKIGNKDSIADTWRCHFEFDHEDLKVVIGHCGKHLDFK